MIKTAPSRKRTRAVYFFFCISLSLNSLLEKKDDLMRERVVVPSFFSRCAFGDDD